MSKAIFASKIRTAHLGGELANLATLSLDNCKHDNTNTKTITDGCNVSLFFAFSVSLHRVQASRPSFDSCRDVIAQPTRFPLQHKSQPGWGFCG